MMHIVCYVRQGSKVFETYWTTRRGVEAMDNSYQLLDLTVYGRQERWEDSPAGWPQRPKGDHHYRIDGRFIAQWSRLKVGYSDDWERSRLPSTNPEPGQITSGLPTIQPQCGIAIGQDLQTIPA